jgi:hypothetical protein
MAETNRAQVDKVVTDRLRGMKTAQSEWAEARLGGKSEAPSLRPEVDGWTGSDPLDIPGTTKAYDRKDIAAAYLAGVSDGANPSPRGEVNAGKISSDLIASMERARRTADATSVRCNIHALSRRQGHGSDGGAIDRMLRYLQNLIRAGQARPK